jgi:hypothetical protein
MTNKHTPAPWHIEWAMAQGGEAHHVCDSRDMSELSIIATVHFHDDEAGETKANANLISAAPELLELVEKLDTILRGMGPLYASGSVAKEVSAAIAKAKEE